MKFVALTIGMKHQILTVSHLADIAVNGNLKTEKGSKNCLYAYFDGSLEVMESTAYRYGGGDPGMLLERDIDLLFTLEGQSVTEALLKL